MTEEVRAKVFWSGGSQSVRLPKELRFRGTEVIARRRGSAVVLEPLPDDDDWSGFWDRLVPLHKPIVRQPTRRVERRKPQ